MRVFFTRRLALRGMHRGAFVARRSARYHLLAAVRRAKG